MTRFPLVRSVCALTCALVLVTGPFSATIPAEALAKRQPTAASNAQIQAAADEAIAFVEGVRQVSFASRPTVEVLQSDAFNRRLAQQLDADPDTKRIEIDMGSTLRALRLLRGKAKARTLLNALMAAGVAGFYDPKTKTMTVRGTQVTPSLRTTLVHELTHALDDQRHTLDRSKLKAATDGSDEAYAFLVEGTARWVENKYRASLSRSDKSLLAAEELAMSADVSSLAVIANRDYVGAVMFLLPALLSPYELGKTMVADLVAAEGTVGLERAFDDVPTTTEQASDYEKYKSREPAIRVAVPDYDGVRLADGVFGIDGFNSLVSMDSLSDNIKLDDAAKGWGGDHYVAYRRRDRVLCFRLDAAMDSAVDADQLTSALRPFVTRIGATLRTTGRTTFRLDSCEQ